MTDKEREKIRATLITHLTNLLRKYPSLTHSELNEVYNDVCQFLIQKRRLKRQK